MGEQKQGFSLKDVFVIVIFVGVFGTLLINLVSGIAIGFRDQNWSPFLKNVVEPSIAADKALYDVQLKLDANNDYDLVEQTALSNARLISFFTFFGIALIFFWCFNFLFQLVSDDGSPNYFLSIITTLLVLAGIEFVYCRFVYGENIIPLSGLYLFFKSSILSIIKFFGGFVG